MKTRAASFILLVLAIATTPFYGAVAASSAPPMGRSQASFEETLRKFYGLVEYQDVQEHALLRKYWAEEVLKANPNSAEGLRDMGDALHTLGHFEEFKENYEAAFKLHTQALEYFERTPLETRESQDKIRHANEHIFFNIYELAFAKSDDFLFRKALDWARVNNFATNPDYGMDYIRARYIDLIKRAPSLMLPPTSDELALTPNCSSWLTGLHDAD